MQYLLSTDRILATGLKLFFLIFINIFIVKLSTDRILATGLKHYSCISSHRKIEAFNWQNPGNGTETSNGIKIKQWIWGLSTDRILATGLKPAYKALRGIDAAFQLTESWQRDWNMEKWLRNPDSRQLSTDRILATGLKQTMLPVSLGLHILSTDRILATGLKQFMCFLHEIYTLLSTDRILATGLKRKLQAVLAMIYDTFQLTESWQRDWNSPLRFKATLVFSFQLTESWQRDWNFHKPDHYPDSLLTFNWQNPGNGTETFKAV